MGWKGESRRHSLSRKGIKTAQSKGNIKRAKGLENTPSNISPYFDLDLSNYNFRFIRDIYEDPEHNDRINERTHEIIFITTDQYLDAIKKGRGDEEIYFSQSKIDKLKMDMIKGDKFAMPYLEYSVLYWDGKPKSSFGQEGIHRAVASKQLGHDTIPVVVIHPTTKEKFDIVNYDMTIKVLFELDGRKINTHEERKQKYEVKYGKHWDM